MRNHLEVYAPDMKGGERGKIEDSVKKKSVIDIIYFF
jgi:hypothetical protein